MHVERVFRQGRILSLRGVMPSNAQLDGRLRCVAPRWGIAGGIYGQIACRTTCSVSVLMFRNTNPHRTASNMKNPIRPGYMRCVRVLR